MARYINKDEFIAQIQDNFCTECNNYDGVKCKSCGIDDTIEMVENADEADVVPKSEVESLAKEVDRLSQVVLYNDGVTQMLVEEAKEKIAREIFEEIEKAFTVKYSMCTNPVLVLDSLSCAELKKKYTEEKE